jgi:hypothetical protein
VTDGWKFTKRTVEQYQFNGPHGAWAIITLDPRGIFQAVSDFGSYSYDGWGHHGCESFKHFLVRLREADYFLSKVCGNTLGQSGPGRCGQIFDYDLSVKEIRRRICEKRREGMPKDEAREAWDELESVEDTNDSTYFVMAVERDCPTLFRRVLYSDYCEVPTCTVLAPVPLRFFNEIFRGQLVPALQAEIDAARTGVSPPC